MGRRGESPTQYSFMRGSPGVLVGLVHQSDRANRGKANAAKVVIASFNHRATAPIVGLVTGFPTSAEHFQAAVVSGGIELEVFNIDANLEVVAVIPGAGIDAHAVTGLAIVLVVIARRIISISVPIVIGYAADR